MNKKSSLKKIKNKKFLKACETIVAEVKRLKIPGVSIGIYHNGKEYAAGFGVTSVENPLPVTADTLFQTGSISKTFTGTIFMRLVEDGKVDLDAPVHTYLPKLKLADKDVAERVTIRHLLTHTGGWIGDYFNEYGNGDDALAKMMRDIAKLEQVTPLGETFSYNNAGFNIAGRVVEVVTGKPFEQAAKELLLDPLGLDMTFYFPDDVMITHRFAVGHHKEGKKVKVSRPWAIGRAGAPVGGVISTVNDLLTYARFHMGDGKAASGEKILLVKNLREMRKPQHPATGFDQIGLTWFIRKGKALDIITHGGATHGQIAGLHFIPEKDFALAVLTNEENGRLVTKAALKKALEVYFKIDTPDPTLIEMTDEALHEYEGNYELPLTAFELKLKKGHLVLYDKPRGGFPTPDSPPLPASPPMRMAFYEKDKIVMLDEPMKGGLGEFLRDADGKLQYFRLSSRVHRKLD
ncbi:MAG: serine hydrolase domain-containing protein [Anaerolineales bacterium]|jgi:CubicO group peptidase (beta-lactamase class C family)